MSIKTVFSIKDLENLSGVKAHTIRIWEKRYNLFEPQRTDTNIRVYGNDELQKILNIAFLNKNGLKVSKIAEISDEEMSERIREFLKVENTFEESYNNFKLAMLNFDVNLFNNTYDSLLKKQPFRTIFIEVFVRLLNEIGVLWHTNTIKPVHEHFISSLVSQKILLNIEKLDIAPNQEKTFVLFLPVNESHQIGLMYLNYELNSMGYKTIYLGPNLPIANLNDLQKIFPNLDYVSYFTVEPTIENTQAYLEEMQRIVLSSRNEKFHVLGRQIENNADLKAVKNISFYKGIEDFVNNLA